MIKRTQISIFAAALLMLSACSKTIPHDLVQDGAIGTVGGAAAGATTGVIVASLSSGIDMGTAAWVGAASGAVIGLVAGVGYSAYQQNEILDNNDRIILQNRAALDARREQIKLLRAQIDAETRALNPDSSLMEYQYTGRTYQNPFR